MKDLNADEKRPKVLFITRKYPPMRGGMEAYSYNLISNYNYPAKVIKLGKKQIHLLWFFPYCMLYVLFNCRKYDVIELGDMLLCGLGWIAKKVNKKIKVVATVHGLDITYTKPVYQLYLKLFSYGFDMYVPNSRYTEQIANQRGYYPTKVIPPATLNDKNSVIEPQNREKILKKYGIPKDTIIITTVGRLVKRKGVQWFIENVLSQIKNENIVYIVIGEGPMRNSIQETINRSQETRVQMLGKVSEEELRLWYAHTDIFLMPNILVDGDVEGYGMVAVEAAAAECIVVAADIQGILDAVNDGTNGFLYESGNPDSLKERLLEIVDDIGKYNKFRKTAREYVLKECTGVAIADKYYRLFEGLFEKCSDN